MYYHVAKVSGARADGILVCMRYDNAYPSDDLSAMNIEIALEDKTEFAAEICKVSQLKTAGFREGKWQSHGFKIEVLRSGKV